MSGVTLENVTLQYPGAERPSVSNVNLDIKEGEFLVLVGPSGCGKSTTLRMIAGLEDITSGTITIGGKDVTNVAPKDRDIAMVFQNYALYPHMTVRENIAFSLKVAKYPKEKRNQRVEEAAKLLDLTDYLDRKPKALSGGQRQRVAMGRAIVRSPRAFLMDEPLSNLDAKLRVQTRTQISELTRQLGVTTVYVTHDQTEAMTMGDRVAVLKDGVLQQVDTPSALYDKPANEFVAGFIGSPSMNLFRCSVDSAGAKMGNSVISLPDSVRAKLTGDTVSVGVRPEDLQIVGAGEGIPVHVDLVEELGADAYVYASIPRSVPVHLARPSSDRPAQVILRVPGRSSIRQFDQLNIAPQGNIHFFDAATGENIGL
ncbi:MAG TPA: sn-glycerol-3-phosphate ABC transporter ATP-binding protein UgpC [Candidatus Rothia avicola]|uniref:Sn-glycerol-3-phosphate ABC transporter ATP-binding protein UgpC n=1 Tax=Candidatus Rothia avicola TaxID=2840478 RepID=A0A9D2CRP9_9MICC|nr:sn-glycerol-3-phosphate ABC transporter ATP-binding protein UgpC [Candidatus Rothia avicola]